MGEDGKTEDGQQAEKGQVPLVPQPARKLPLWVRIPIFPIALFLGVIIGSVAGCIVGICLLFSWVQDQYDQFVYPEENETTAVQ